MKKRTKTDFADFKRYFKEYQRKFGLAGYRVYFKRQPMDGYFAEISYRQNEMVATVKLNPKLKAAGTGWKDIKGHAKHEALHLLVARLSHLAATRFVVEEQIDEAEEELINKLEGLIK